MIITLLHNLIFGFFVLKLDRNFSVIIESCLRSLSTDLGLDSDCRSASWRIVPSLIAERVAPRALSQASSWVCKSDTSPAVDSGSRGPSSVRITPLATASRDLEKSNLIPIPKKSKRLKMKILERILSVQWTRFWHKLLWRRLVISMSTLMRIFLELGLE